MTINTPKVNSEDFYRTKKLCGEVKWLQDREYQKGLLDLWGLCKSEEYKLLVENLLKRLTHLDSYSMNELAYKLIDQIDQWEFNSEDTMILATSNGEEIDGSIYGLQILKNKLDSNKGWSERNLVPNFNASLNYLKGKDNKNIIIFDDFVGSGKTIVKKYKEFDDLVKSYNIKVRSIRIMSYVSMQSGLLYVNKEVGEKFFSPLVLKKGITDYEVSPKKEVDISNMISLEKNLQKKLLGLHLKDFELGFGRSETLYQIYGNNCSNNVFPIFWWPKLHGGKVRNTLFKRLR